MYFVRYIFYKVRQTIAGVPEAKEYYDIKAKTFEKPQDENTFVRKMRADGYMCKRVERDIYLLITSESDVEIL